MSEKKKATKAKKNRVRRFATGLKSKTKAGTKRVGDLFRKAGRGSKKAALKTGRATRRGVTATGRGVWSGFTSVTMMIGYALLAIARLAWALVTGLLALILNLLAFLLASLSWVARTAGVGTAALALILTGSAQATATPQAPPVHLSDHEFPPPIFHEGPAVDFEHVTADDFKQPQDRVEYDETLIGGPLYRALYHAALEQGNIERAGFEFGRLNAALAKEDDLDPAKAWALVHKEITAHGNQLRVKDVKKGWDAEMPKPRVKS